MGGARRCPYPTCNAVVERSKILCWNHWDRVPVADQKALRSASARRALQPENPVYQRLFRALLLKALEGIAESLAARQARKEGRAA